ncbi:cytotoxin 1b-like [Xenopus laevis]|uniref:Cytotoxin 1b-like n=1 Tax=Xenopus laevis TaxID=8355 RepID=A0A3Q8S4U8_XENLA|nr:cytotoxin 1b-like [Xenopus laevis]XP_041432377.1 cytotoxin 1b-like [Xenopus laevis]AZK16921.1 Tfp6 [Xenopus laevis]
MMLPLVLLVLGLFADWGMALKCNTLIEGRKEVTECPPGQKICMTHSISNNNRTDITKGCTTFGRCTRRNVFLYESEEIHCCNIDLCN